MADAVANDTVDSAMTPAEVARHKFELERRGFDQRQVRAYLIAVADALSDAQRREADMRSRLAKAVRRAEKAEASVRAVPTDDASSLTRQVGDEVTAVLDAARVAGEQKIAAAEKSAESLLANAKQEATEIRKAADSIMDVRRAEADAAAEELVNGHRAEAEQIVATARADADALRRDAAGDVDRVRNECDNLIREAEDARAQILLDMERRRRQARAQVERLRVGRDRLLRSYDVVRRTLDESTTELKSSLKEAKVLGDTAARTIASESLREPAQLEAELADRALIGRGPSTNTPSGRGGSASARPASAARQAPGGSAPQTPGTAGGIAVPHVDMRPGVFSGEVAPTPKRPTASRAIARDTTVPTTPVVAPQIKAPEPTAADGAAIARVADSAGRPTADASLEAADDGTAVATIVLDVPTIEQPAPVAEVVPGEAVADAVADELVADAALSDSASAAIADDATSVDNVDCDDDFSDLPKAELAIVVASDDIEQVVALAPAADDAAADVVAVAAAADEAVVEIATDDADADADADEVAAEADADADEVAAEADADADEVAAEATADEIADTDEVAAEVTAGEIATGEAADEAPAAGGLFAALRAQAANVSAGPEPAVEAVATDDDEPAQPVEAAATDADEPAQPVEAAATDDEPEPAVEAAAIDDLDVADDAATPADDATLTDETASADHEGDRQLAEAQKAALIAGASTDLVKRLKRALADEQNDVLAGIRAAGRRPAELISYVGETDDHIGRYVHAITEVAAEVYASGTELVDGCAELGAMPAGAVEELIGSIVVLPIRLRLIELDALDVDHASVHVDAVRAFYRQRKTDHLAEAAEALASLLVTAGVCDARPPVDAAASLTAS